MITRISFKMIFLVQSRIQRFYLILACSRLDLTNQFSHTCMETTGLTSDGFQGQLKWAEEVFGFYSVDSNPLLLCGWVVGQAARDMEQSTDAQVRVETVYFIHLMFYLFYKKLAINKEQVLRQLRCLLSQRLRRRYKQRMQHATPL